MTIILKELTVPEGLLESILGRITRAQQRAARLKLVAFGVLTAVSVALLVPSIQYLLNELYVSGFTAYASLLLDGFALGYWQETFLALADAVPSFAVLLLVIISTLFVWSLRHTRRNVSVAFAALA